MLFLNLGCSNYKISGFVNLDSDPTCNPDVVGDATCLEYDDCSVDFIYAGHLLEHINSHLTISVIKEWHRVLRYGGCIMCVTPDVAIAAAMHRRQEIDNNLLEAIIYGKGEHKTFFTQEKLLDCFKQVFPSVHKLDLDQCPYLLVSDVKNPVPDKWQSGAIAVKL